MKIIVSTFLAGILALSACTAGEKSKESGREAEEDRQAMAALKGLWLDDNTELPVFSIDGDSVRFSGQANAAFRFSITGDTLKTYGAGTTAYIIERREEHLLRFRTPAGDLVALHKAENEDLSLGYQTVAPQRKEEVVKKDSVVVYKGKRYRGYVYINPSTIKVVRPGVTEEGLSVDNIYYDHVIHICVYQGKEKIYAKDITRKMFEGIVPSDFLQTAILWDMNFMGADGEGFHYVATVRTPDTPLCYYVELRISPERELSFRLKN